VQPVQHGLLLRHTCVLPSGFRVVVALHGGAPLGFRFPVVGFFPTGADEEHVAGLDDAALGRGPDVEALVRAAGSELGPRYGMRGVGIVSYVLGVGVGPVVEEDPAACDAVGCPVVYGAFVWVGAWTGDVAAFSLVGCAL